MLNWKTALLISFFFLHVSKKPSMCYFIIARLFLTHLFCYILKHRRSVLHYLKSFLTSAAIELKESFLIFKHMVWYISHEGRRQQLTLFLVLYFITKPLLFKKRSFFNLGDFFSPLLFWNTTSVSLTYFKGPCTSIVLHPHNSDDLTYSSFDEGQNLIYCPALVYILKWQDICVQHILFTQTWLSTNHCVTIFAFSFPY